MSPRTKAASRVLRDCLDRKNTTNFASQHSASRSNKYAPCIDVGYLEQ